MIDGIPKPMDYERDIFEVISREEIQTIFKVTQLVSKSIREFLESKGFLEFVPPIIGPVTDPGIRGAKQAEIDYYGRPYKVMSSAILYKQLLAMSSETGKIFFFSPNIRLEPVESATTGRHLAEFIQVDLEVRGADHFEVMKIAEEMIVHVLKDMKKFEHEIKKCWEKFLINDGLLKKRTEIKIPSLPFKRYSHREAVELIKETIEKNPEILEEIKKLFGTTPKKLDEKSEIPWEYEWLLSKMHEEPFFIYDYPKGSRGFYDREYKDKPGILMDFDLIAPEGYGELISGAAREYELEKVIERMKESGEPIQKYDWYLRFLKEHGGPTAGFGIGLERFVRFITGAPSVYLVRPYPKIPGIYTP